MRKAFAATLALVATLGLAAPIQGETPGADAVGNKLMELGLLGRWARDCSLPLQSGNPFIFFERTDAGPRYRFVFGPTSQTVRSVDSVEALGDGTILMRVTNISGDEPGFRIELKMAMQEKRYRVLYSKGSDGKVYVENGVIVATRQPNHWQQYCGPS